MPAELPECIPDRGPGTVCVLRDPCGLHTAGITAQLPANKCIGLVINNYLGGFRASLGPCSKRIRDCFKDTVSLSMIIKYGALQIVLRSGHPVWHLVP